MGLRWDWLQPLITAPYVPTLGPAHPQAIAPGLFADVVGIAGTGRFLPHDKDRRWAGRKDEQVLAGAITQEPGLVLVPALSSRRRAVKIHIYSQAPARRAEPGRRAGQAAMRRARRPGRDGSSGSCRQAATLIPWRRAPVSRCGPSSPAIPPPPRTPSPVLSCWTRSPGPVRATFSEFAQKLAAEGFAFLDARIREHGGTGPVLTCLRDAKIVGAIGPMEIMPDSSGTARLLPQYFGVLPEYRGLGLGRSLWRAAMQWGQQHQAAYQLLQTEAGGASDRLCQSEGLADLGLVCTSTL